MGIIKQEEFEKNKSAPVDKTMYIADEKIDRKGQAWKKKSIWLRKEHLGKLEVISHFEKKPVQKLIDMAISEYLGNKWDNSMALKKMVKK
ncbi:MAG: hypothetical protein V3V99_02530 [candidate division Zixibacteria bacterium]